jgi:hypothetical protein
MIQPAPIFLLINDEVDGPYELESLEEKVARCAIGKTTLSCIEGMRDWRSIPETMAWSYAKLLNLFKEQALEMVVRMASHELEVREARSEVLEKLRKSSCFKFPDAHEILAEVIYINGRVMENHRRYVSRQMEWDVEAMQLWPAAEIVLYSKQKFRRDWDAEWQRLGGTIYHCRKIAKKGDEIWMGISDFGFPFPPFSMDPWVWMDAVSIDEAEEFKMPGLDQPICLPEIKPFELIGL